MKNLFVILIGLLFFSSCALFKNKEKTIDNTVTEIKEEKTVEESEIDTSTFKTYSKITYGGVSNPFITSEGIKFTEKLNSLTVLNLNSKELESTVKDLKADFRDMVDAASKGKLPTIEEKWTDEKTGKSSAKKTAEQKQENKEQKRKEIVTDGIMQSIPWYVWLGGLIILIFIILVKKTI